MQVTKVRLTRERGRLVLQAMRQTVRGQSYVSARTVMDSLAMHDQGFKTELPLAIGRLFDEAVDSG